MCVGSEMLIFKAVRASSSTAYRCIPELSPLRDAGLLFRRNQDASMAMVDDQG